MIKSRIFLRLFFITILLSNVLISKADMPDNHKPILCIGCHKETLGASSGKGECGHCHYYKFPAGGINVPLMEQQHNPNICRACHMGNTLANASARDIFHNGHSAVKCSRCHISDNSAVVKIEGIEEKGFPCVECHGNQIHSIHVKNLDKACLICHGSWAKGKVYKSKVSSISLANAQENTRLERFTLFSFIKNFFNYLLGVAGSQ